MWWGGGGAICTHTRIAHLENAKGVARLDVPTVLVMVLKVLTNTEAPPRWAGVRRACTARDRCKWNLAGACGTGKAKGCRTGGLESCGTTQ